MAFGIPSDLRNLDHRLDTWAEAIETMEERALEAELERQFALPPALQVRALYPSRGAHSGRRCRRLHVIVIPFEGIAFPPA
jgi:hypothetical protein